MLVQPTAFCVGLKQKRQSVQGLRSFTHALTQTHHAMKIEQIDCGAHHSLTANSLCSGEVQEQAVTHIQPVDPYTQPKCFLSVFCFSCFFVLVVWWHPPPPVWPLGLFADGCLSPGTNSTPPPLLNPTIKTMHIETHTYPSTKTFFSPFVRLLCLCTNKTQNIAARLNQQANTVGHLPHTSNHHSCVRVFVCVCVRVCVCACVGVWVCVCSLPSSPSFLPPFSFFFFFLVLHFAIFFFPFLCVRLHSMSRSREYTTTVPLPVPSSLRCCLGHASSARRCLSWFLLVGIFFLSLLVSALSVVQPDVQVSPPLSPVLSLFASFLLFVFSCFHLFFLLACLVSSLPSSQSPPPITSCALSPVSPRSPQHHCQHTSSPFLFCLSGTFFPRLVITPPPLHLTPLTLALRSSSSATSGFDDKAPTDTLFFFSTRTSSHFFFAVVVS